MHSTSIIVLVLGIFTTMALARPGRRPWFGHHHHEKPDNELSGQRPWRTYRLPGHIRLPRLLAGKLEEPIPTFIPKKIMEGKYLLISPALIFKVKETDPEASTTVIPETSTTDDVDEDTATDAESEEIASNVPPFESRSFSFDDDDDDDDDADEEDFSSLDD